jgi:hypothetical protein
MRDITNAEKAININEGGNAMTRKAANTERQVRINRNRKGGSILIFNYSLFSFP